MRLRETCGLGTLRSAGLSRSHIVEDEPKAASSRAHSMAPGRPRVLTSVLWSWGGHLVFIISGFLLPRVIDRTAGRELLGIWDFSWSIVAYFYLIEFGVSSSVNRFVARHIATNDLRGLNRSVSSVFCLQLLAALAILLVTVLTVLLLPLLWRARLGSYVADAQWLVFFLGLGMSIGFGTGAYAGVLTGCHRWDLYSGISSAGQGICTAAMLGSLVLDGNIRWLGAMYTASGVLVAIANIVAAHRICPGLRVRLYNADRTTMFSMLTFGGKTFVNGLSRSLLFQTNSVLMATYLGPAALALYSRPVALVQQLRTLTSKFAHVLTPVASEMQAEGGTQSVQDLAMRMARTGAALALPPVLFLSILGGCLLRLWMGPDYQEEALPAILAIGSLWAIASLPLQTILTGLNAHGRPALISVISSAVCAACCWVLLESGFGMTAVAACVGATLMLADGAFVTYYACCRLGLSFRLFLRQVWVVPLICVIPFGICLVLARIVMPPLQALLLAFVIGGVVLGLPYWIWVLPTSVKTRLRRKWSSLISRIRRDAAI